MTLAHDAASGFKSRLPKQALSKAPIPTLGSRRKPICEQNNRSTLKIVVPSRQVNQNKIRKTQIVPKRANLADLKLRIGRYAKGRRQPEMPSILAGQLAENRSVSSEPAVSSPTALCARPDETSTGLEEANDIIVVLGRREIR